MSPGSGQSPDERPEGPAEVPLDSALDAAIGYFNSGKLAEAEEAFKKILPFMEEAQKAGGGSGVAPLQANIYNILGLSLQMQGKLDEAAESFEKSISINPDFPNAHLNLGKALFGVDRLDEAAASFAQAANLDPELAEAHSSLGIVSMKRGRIDEAIERFGRVLAINPDSAEGHNNSGVALLERGRIDEASAAFRRALEIKSDFADARFNLAKLLRDKGDIDAAEAGYRETIRIDPGYIKAYLNLGPVLHEQGNEEEAATVFREAIALDPRAHEAHFGLGSIYRSEEKFDEAADCLREAIRLHPTYREAHFHLAGMLAFVGKFEEAKSARGEMDRLFPDDALLRLGSDVSCPGIFNSAGEMDAWRAEMEEALGGYSEDSLRFDLDDLTYVRLPPYYTLFHGRNEKPWKCKFAKLFSDKFRRKYPELMKPVHTPGENSARRGPIRVGFVNANKEGPFLLWLRGLMVNLSRERFSVTVLCYEKSRQNIIDGLEKFDGGANIEGVGNDSGVDFFYLDSLSMEDMIKRIRAEKFDALLYNEVGTRTANFILPFFRLAPVQCGYWCGATSGSPEMDYFISSDLVEPGDGQDYVLEKLVRLKSPLIHFTSSRMPVDLKSRSFYGLPETAHIYSCFQNLHKLHPDIDEVFGNILRRDPDGLILLLEGTTGDWSDALMNRLRSAIPDLAGRVRMIPRMLHRHYLNVLAISDVILDSIHHNGGTTSYESLTAGAPIVTWPSRIGFGRYMSALYGKMNVMDCVASSLEEYVDIAVRLGTDPSFRESVMAKILASRHLVFEDMEFVREMEKFLENAVIEARRADPRHAAR